MGGGTGTARPSPLTGSGGSRPTGGALEAQPHLPGTEEYVTVFAGEAEIGLPGETYRLRTGDSLRFPADQPHRYRNPGTEETQLSMLIWYRH